jgi:hypothetical protein
MSDRFITVVGEQWRTRLGDACRSLAWSPRGRLMSSGPTVALSSTSQAR